MALRFRLTVPHDVQLVGAVRQVADRVAQCSGFSAADAETIASSVAGAAEVIIAGSRSAEGLDIRFERDATHLVVWLRYRGVDGGRLSGAAAAFAQEVADAVEIGREDEVSYWRLRRALPHEKVDHRCELPPER